MKGKREFFKDQADAMEYIALNSVVDVINLLLSMYLGLLLLNNPVFGAALHVSSLFLASFIRLFLDRERRWIPWKSRALWGALFLVALALDFALVVLYPSLQQDPSSLLVCAFVLLLALRSMTQGFVHNRFPGKKSSRRLLAQAVEIVFMVPIIILTEQVIPGLPAVIVYTAYLLAGFIIQTERSRGYENRLPPRPAQDLRGVSSYSLYQATALCAYVAFYLALFLYISYIFCFQDSRQINVLLSTAGWLALVCVTTYVTYRMIARPSRAVSTGLFVAGACMWLVASAMMFQTKNTVESIWWSMLWAVGISLMYAVLARMEKSFRLLSVLLEREVPEAVLRRNALVIQNFAVLIAGIILMGVLTAWSFLFPSADGQIELYFSGGVTLLPMPFMLAGIYFALQQPMDNNAEERLKKLSRGGGTEEMRLRLNTILVGKYRKRVGVRIIMAVLRPIMRHKVIGRENVKTEDFPAIFVCNHGEIYGPVAAVLYLPYYFRPWIDERMLNTKKIAPHVYKGTLIHQKWLPGRAAKRWVARLIGVLAPWAFSAFDPIPVYRENLRSIFKTFDLSVKAMQAEENILLFPEDPDKTRDGRYAEGDVGSFFTGFAHVGKAYYAKTGKCATFYPIYSDKKKRIFQIGSGIRYNPENPQAEEKLRIARELNQVMKQMTEAGEQTARRKPGE